MNKISFTMLVSFISNTFLALFKVITGIIFRCISLISDGIHTFSDLSTDLMILLQEKSNSKANKIYIYSLALGIIIVLLGLLMIYFTMNNNFKIIKTYALISSVLTIIFKFMLVNYLKKNGKIYNNQILNCSAKESNLDLASSFVVMISIILSYFSNKYSMLNYSDIVGSIIVSIFVIYSGFQIVSDNIKNIFGVSEKDLDYLGRIKNTILLDNMIKLDDLKITRYDNYYYVKCRLLLDGNLTLSDANLIKTKLETRLHNYDKRIDTISVHVKIDEKE